MTTASARCFSASSPKRPARERRVRRCVDAAIGQRPGRSDVQVGQLDEDRRVVSGREVRGGLCTCRRVMPPSRGPTPSAGRVDPQADLSPDVERASRGTVGQQRGWHRSCPSTRRWTRSPRKVRWPRPSLRPSRGPARPSGRSSGTYEHAGRRSALARRQRCAGPLDAAEPERRCAATASAIVRSRVHAAEELGDERIAGDRGTALGVADLHDRAGAHHGEPVGDRERLVLVVRDMDRGDAGAGEQLGELVAQATFSFASSAAERLVEQQHARLDRDRAGERDALALAARQLGGRCSRARSGARGRPALADATPPLGLGRRRAPCRP